MHIPTSFFNWLWSVVVVGIIVGVSGNLLTQKLKDWYASQSASRARKRLREIVKEHEEVEKMRRDFPMLQRFLWRCLFEAIWYLVAGLGLWLYPVFSHNELTKFLVTLKQALGVGLLVGAVRYGSTVAVNRLNAVENPGDYAMRTWRRAERLMQNLPPDDPATILPPTISPPATP